MRPARWGVLVVCVVAVLVAMLAPMASAKPAPPTPVLAPASGVWTWTYVDYGIDWSAMLDNWSYNFNDAERGSGRARSTAGPLNLGPSSSTPKAMRGR